MAERCNCGRPLTARPGDMDLTCAECCGLPDSCDCEPLAEELPGPSSPMAVARVILDDHLEQAHLTLRRWRGSWMQWRRAHWAEAEDAAIRSALYQRLEHATYTDTSGKTPVTRNWQPTRRKIGDLEDALAAAVHLPGDTSPPAWIGGGPVPAGEVVACANGLLHVGTRKLLDHTPRFFGTVSVPFAYDAAAPPPERWLKFLGEIWGEDQDSVKALQEWFGYVLSGRTDLHKILMLIGPTRSGKGTIARVLTALIGEGNAAGPTLASLGTNFGLQPLLGKPLALVSDARLGGNENEVVERLLSISGEDTLTVDRKYHEPWTGKLAARFMILSNELPRFGDASGAIANRFVVLVMHQSFLGREDSALTGKLLAELPGILSWALDGLDRLARTGRLTSPKSSEDAITALHDLVSPVSAFVRDWCETGTGEIRVSALFGAWKCWAEANNHRPGNSATFGRNLHAVLPALQVSQPRAEGSRERIYVGITLNATGFGDARVPSRATDEEHGRHAMARDGTRSQQLSRTHATEEPMARTAHNGDSRVPRVPPVPEDAGQYCADPSCRGPLDPALVSAGVTAHPNCRDPYSNDPPARRWRS